MHEAPTMVVDDECVRLERMAASKDRALARRAKVVLLANQGMTDAQIGDALGSSRKTAWRWRTRFAAGGIAQIECERPRSGRRPVVRERVARMIIETTLRVRPENASCWSTRRLAEVLGVSRAMVHRVWR